MSPHFFKRMLAPECMVAARQFLDNERFFLIRTLSQLDRNRDVVVVGCGNSAYYELVVAMRYSYTGIDPYVETNKPWIVTSTIESFIKCRNSQKNYIFLFWFNVIAHIKKNEIAPYLAKGDILINSTWNKSKTAYNICENYYSTCIKNTSYPSATRAMFHSNRSLTSMNVRIESIATEIKEPNLFELAFL